MTQDIVERLLACPFCAGEPEIVDGFLGCHFVKCKTCNASTDDCAIERAIVAWNRRPEASTEITTLRDRVAKLEEAIRKEAIPTLSAVRATAGGDEWEQSALHFHGVCLVAILALNEALHDQEGENHDR